MGRIKLALNKKYLEKRYSAALKYWSTINATKFAGLDEIPIYPLHAGI